MRTYGWLSPEQLKLINDNPKIVSLLYDLSILPEEISARVRGYVEEERERCAKIALKTKEERDSLQAENAKLSAEIERLSKGIYDNTTYPEPLISGSAVDSAIALIKNQEKMLLQNDMLRGELASTAEWLLAQDSVAGQDVGRRIKAILWNTATPEQRKAPFAEKPVEECRCASIGLHAVFCPIYKKEASEKRIDERPS